MKHFVTASTIAVFLLSAAGHEALAGGPYFGHHGHFGHHYHHHHSGIHFSFGLGHHYGYGSVSYPYHYHYPLYSYSYWTRPYYLYSYPTYSAYRWVDTSPWCSSRVIYRTETGQTRDQMDTAPAVPEPQIRKPAPDPPPEPLPKSEDLDDSVRAPGNLVSEPVRFVALKAVTHMDNVGKRETLKQNTQSPANHDSLSGPAALGPRLPVPDTRPLFSDDEVPWVAE